MAGTPPPFGDDTDEDLVAYMAMKDDPSRQDAGTEFYRRHKEFVFGVLMKTRAGRLVGGEDGLCDVVNEAFFRAYQAAETYRPCGATDRDSQRRACRRWLIGIAKNVVKEGCGRSPSIKATVSVDECLDLPDVAVADDEESTAVRLLGEAMERNLTERERDVLRSTMLFYKPGEKNQRMPSGSAAALADQYGTTTENIRAIRKRAIDKLRSVLEHHFSAKQEART
jgi:RNA polymerase sigma factor (sigma-70 family)